MTLIPQHIQQQDWQEIAFQAWTCAVIDHGVAPDHEHDDSLQECTNLSVLAAAQHVLQLIVPRSSCSIRGEIAHRSCGASLRRAYINVM